jgi:hypothetical protein
MSAAPAHRCNNSYFLTTFFSLFCCGLWFMVCVGRFELSDSRSLLLRTAVRWNHLGRRLLRDCDRKTILKDTKHELAKAAVEGIVLSAKNYLIHTCQNGPSAEDEPESNADAQICRCDLVVAVVYILGLIHKMVAKFKAVTEAEGPSEMDVMDAKHVFTVSLLALCLSLKRLHACICLAICT